ncbi:hypothetical protein [Serratia plymuthica]|uniref:hypothetical protein n=1 Tax=Serratia plymuthica TaxID=82996 RepID=UPI001F357D2A|nr:hypothetical protein [Serratia plymuthica]
MTDQDLRVTLVQSDIIWEDAERNRRRMAEHIAAPGQQGPAAEIREIVRQGGFLEQLYDADLR